MRAWLYEDSAWQQHCSGPNSLHGRWPQTPKTAVMYGGLLSLFDVICQKSGNIEAARVQRRKGRRMLSNWLSTSCHHRATRGHKQCFLYRIMMWTKRRMGGSPKLKVRENLHPKKKRLCSVIPEQSGQQGAINCPASPRKWNSTAEKTRAATTKVSSCKGDQERSLRARMNGSFLPNIYSIQDWSIFDFLKLMKVTVLLLPAPQKRWKMISSREFYHGF